MRNNDIRCNRLMILPGHAYIAETSTSQCFQSLIDVLALYVGDRCALAETYGNGHFRLYLYFFTSVDTLGNDIAFRNRITLRLFYPIREVTIQQSLNGAVFIHSCYRGDHSFIAKADNNCHFGADLYPLTCRDALRDNLILCYTLIGFLRNAVAQFTFFQQPNSSFSADANQRRDIGIFPDTDMNRDFGLDVCGFSRCNALRNDQALSYGIVFFFYHLVFQLIALQGGDCIVFCHVDHIRY